MEVTQRQEEIARAKAESQAVTAKRNAELQEQMIGQQLSVQQAKIKAELETAQKQKEANLAKEEVLNVASQGELARAKARADQDAAVESQKQTLRLEGIKAETDAMTRRFDSAQKGFSEALLQLQSQDTLIKVAQAMSVQQFIGGKDIVEVIQKLFNGSGLDGLLKAVTDRAGALPAPTGNSNSGATAAGSRR